MNIISWNCRGLGNPHTIQELRELVRKKSPHLIFLCEMKSNFAVIEKLKLELGFFGVAVASSGRSGGLALLWSKNIQASLRSFSRNLLDVDLWLSDYCVRVTRVYGKPNVSFRRQFWRQFVNINSAPNIPWLCFGDFNEVLSQVEFQGSGLRANWQLQIFRDALSSCSLSDMGFKGYPFTRQRGTVHPYTQRACLGRCFYNDPLGCLFSWKQVTHIPMIASDHHSLLIEVDVRPSHTIYPACDLWYWHFTKNGKHTVHSAYHAYLDARYLPIKDKHHLFAQSSSGMNPTWKYIWNLKIPPRIQHFLWRCCKGSVATKDNLAHHSLDSQNPCQVCASSNNTAYDAFFHCPFAQKVWKISGLLNILNKFKQPSWSLWLQELIINRSSMPIELIATTFSLIWYHRNRLKHEGVTPDPLSTSLSACYLLRDYQFAHLWPERQSPSLAHHPLLNTQPPGPKIFFDGAISLARNCAGITNSEEAEFLAIREALITARNLKIQHFSLCGDALSVILAMLEDADCPTTRLYIFSDILALKQSVNIAGVFWMRRSSNVLAHNFAFFAKNMPYDSRSWSAACIIQSPLDVFQHS
ncbi:hypothetical protein DH2020_004047 [Rehmannia glutinosa]|uniref:Reverse transcriptase zinc-binding domain-containing protein n=1 Tax=Rehmannia glutinosa TaxID=99300 RepID=A0ABR0XNR7_REHGL